MGSSPTTIKPRSPTLIVLCLGTFLLFALVTLGSDPWQIEWVGIALVAFVLLAVAAQHASTSFARPRHLRSIPYLSEFIEHQNGCA